MALDMTAALTQAPFSPAAKMSRGGGFRWNRVRSGLPVEAERVRGRVARSGSSRELAGGAGETGREATRARHRGSETELAC